MRTYLMLIILIGNFIAPLSVFAATPLTIQQSIDAKNAEIQALQKEVEAYQQKVTRVQDQASTLQGTLQVISQNQKQLQTNLTLTNKKAQKTSLTIAQNNAQIHDLGKGINDNTLAIAETMRRMRESDETSILGIIVSKDSFSAFLRDVDALVKVQKQLGGQVDSMQSAKTSLERAQQALADRKVELESLTSQLADQKKIVDTQAVEKQTLLTQTKNKESEYQKILDARKKQIEALEAEIFNYESQLKFTLSSKSLPTSGGESLQWPVDSVLITQRFGATVDAKRLYVSGSHSGIDFRAAVGTPIYAVASGIVEGVGDTDKTCPKASFGKWVFIRHENGLATAYGHLSLIKATEGQKVAPGDLIAYSGNTGHSTAPHLHLTVYASNGVNGEEGARVAERPSASCNGKTYRMPIAPTNAYLDPLVYLPKTTASMFKN